jgi:LPXTG-motif cell wall-anchored protein
MRVNHMFTIMLVAVVALAAGAASAQTTTYEIRQGTVLHVDGNHLFVKMADGTVRDAEVPSDFMFDVDGKKVSVFDLEPGTELTQTIKTVTTPEVVKHVEVREAEIVQRKGQTVIYRDASNKLNMITGIPEGWIVYRDGKPVPIEALAGGDRVTAYIVHKDVKMVTEEEMRVAGMAPVAAPKPAPAPKAAPAPAPAPAPVLPKTGSSLPLVGLAGLTALVLGLGLAVARRF